MDAALGNKGWHPTTAIQSTLRHNDNTNCYKILSISGKLINVRSQNEKNHDDGYMFKNKEGQVPFRGAIHCNSVQNSRGKHQQRHSMDILWTFERHSSGCLCGCPEFQMKTVIAWYNFLSESKKKKQKKF